MKFDRNVLQVNAHRLWESDFWWRSWRPPAAHSIICNSVRRLPASSLNACLQFLIHSAFVLLRMSSETESIWMKFGRGRAVTQKNLVQVLAESLQQLGLTVLKIVIFSVWYTTRCFGPFPSPVLTKIGMKAEWCDLSSLLSVLYCADSSAVHDYYHVSHRYRIYHHFCCSSWLFAGKSSLQSLVYS